MKLNQTAIRELRKLRGMTQTDLGSEIGVTKGTIALIEQGQRNISTALAMKICEVFGITMSQLFGEENIKQLMVMKVLPQLREEKHLSQRALAESIGTDLETVSDWEKGRKYPSDRALKVLSNFFDVSLEYLEGASEERDPLFCDALDDNYRRAYVKGETDMRDTVIATIIGMQNGYFPESREYAALQKLYSWIKEKYGGLYSLLPGSEEK